MSMPKIPARFALYYRQLGILCASGRLSSSAESRFPVQEGVTAETTRARFCGFRRALMESSIREDREMGEAMSCFAARGEGDELVLRPLGRMKRHYAGLPGFEELMGGSVEAGWNGPRIEKGAEELQRAEEIAESQARMLREMEQDEERRARDAEELRAIGERLGMGGVRVTGEGELKWNGKRPRAELR